MRRYLCLFFFVIVPLAQAHATVDASLPSFRFTPQTITTTCNDAIAHTENALAELAKLPQDQYTFETTIGALNAIEADFDEATSAILFLKHVAPRKDIRDTAQACMATAQKLFSVDIFTRDDIFAVVKGYADKKEQLPNAYQQLLDDWLDGFKFNGFFLPKDKREEVVRLKKELIEQTIAFDTNLNEHRDFLAVTKEELDGLPESFFEGLEKTPDGKYKVTLAYPDYIPVMDNARNGEVRRKLQTKFYNRAGDKNVAVLENILMLRNKIANMVGYKTHADVVLEDRMAKNPQTVQKFLKNLHRKLRRHAEDELVDILRRKQAIEGPKATAVYNWDIMYYLNQAKITDYKVDDQKIKEYFPLHRVIDGMFDIYQQVFGLTFKKLPATDVWHPDVELFSVSDTASGKLLGHFYIDLFPREGKYNHAAAWGLTEGHRLQNGTYQLPVSALVTNFTKPTATKPSLLTHDEVETLFHEFGHVVHNLSSHAEYIQLSGHRVSRDFIEAPSQMLENWVWEPTVIAKISGYYRKESEPLPQETINQMIAAKNVYAGIRYSGQIMYGMYDQYCHTHENVDTTAVAKQMWKTYRLVDLPPDTKWQAGFGHLIGYDAAYYGYLWSEVFAADMFSRFKKEGVLNPKTGMDYRKFILEPGATKDEMAMLVDFLGRKPNQEAFLESIGLKK